MQRSMTVCSRLYEKMHRSLAPRNTWISHKVARLEAFTSNCIIGGDRVKIEQFKRRK